MTFSILHRTITEFQLIFWNNQPRFLLRKMFLVMMPI